MNGNKILADSNVILYLLNGNKNISEILNNREIHISFFTELEILSYAKLSNEEIIKINSFLSSCFIEDINQEIKNRTVELRSKYSLKLPDAIIAATADYFDFPLITSDKHFQRVNELTILYIEI
ncbi:MAG: type II toxin-antitoxin system VapC family toxin [Ignavibacteriae bacterium]|nr:MAG: type II toxin-antitoxin system VapC family toxin [Ignavibacteriota bacterium]